MKLKTEFYEVDILGYFDWSGAIRIDLKLNSYEELKEFLSFVSENDGKNGLFEFEIGTQKYRGHCGAYYYDQKYNARLIMLSMSDEEFEEENYPRQLFLHNLNTILTKQREAIIEIAEALKEKGIIGDDISERVANYMPEIEYGQGVGHLVDNLGEFLKSDNECLEDLEEKRRQWK